MAHSRTEIVQKRLESYANRGVFRSFACISKSNKAAHFRMQWHKDKLYDIVFDAEKQSLRCLVVLPKVPPEMYADFKNFAASRQSDEMLPHRRIDPKKIRISTSRKNGGISLLFTSKDNDLEYAVEKLINLIHEVFLNFLKDGAYYEYMIETFEIDRDQLAG